MRVFVGRRPHRLWSLKLAKESDEISPALFPGRKRAVGRSCRLPSRHTSFRAFRGAALADFCAFPSRGAGGGKWCFSGPCKTGARHAVCASRRGSAPGAGGSRECRSGFRCRIRRGCCAFGLRGSRAYDFQPEFSRRCRRFRARSRACGVLRRGFGRRRRFHVTAGDCADPQSRRRGKLHCLSGGSRRAHGDLRFARRQWPGVGG